MQLSHKVTGGRLVSHELQCVDNGRNQIFAVRPILGNCVLGLVQCLLSKDGILSVWEPEYILDNCPL